MAGRKPKPTWLKDVSGNPGKRSQNKNEPKPARATSHRAPAGLSPEAKKHWAIVAKQLADVGILTNLDKSALVVYCEAWARWRIATDHVHAEGMLVTQPGGYLAQNPYLSIANKAFDHLQKLMVEFGMTPSSRTRIEVPPAEQADPMEAFLQKGKGKRA